VKGLGANDVKGAARRDDVAPRSSRRRATSSGIAPAAPRRETGGQDWRCKELPPIDAALS
jgi:hypothetical protein